MSEITTLTGKEEFVAQCVASGKTRADCEQVWDAGHGEKNLDTQDYSDLIRTSEMQKVKIQQLEAALREATDIIRKGNTERDAVIEARKYELALELERDSNGKLKHGDLMKEELKDLTIMKKAIDVANPKTFPSLSQIVSSGKQKNRAPRLTVGEWDPDTRQYKGGV